jgi:hypothetical protein
MDNHPTAEGLAAMALSNALLAVMLKNGLLTEAQGIQAIDHAQFRLEQLFPNHPGQRKAVVILESVLRELQNRRPEES